MSMVKYGRYLHAALLTQLLLLLLLLLLAGCLGTGDWRPHSAANEPNASLTLLLLLLLLQDALAQVTGARTVPRVFIGNKFVGGGDDTARLAENGKLRKLLVEFGLLQQQQEKPAAAAAAAASGDADDDEYADVE
jgi:hypothetical protein